MQAVSGKIEKVVSKDQSRPVLTNVNLRTDADGSRWLEATDSYKLIRVPARGAIEPDTDGLIPAHVFADARKAKPAAHDGTAILANGVVNFALPGGGHATVDRPEGQFPDCSRLIPEASHVVFEVGINAKLLYELAQGIGSDNVRLGFVAQSALADDSAQGPSPLRAIRVCPMGAPKSVADPDTVGVLMPVRIG